MQNSGSIFFFLDGKQILVSTSSAARCSKIFCTSSRKTIGLGQPPLPNPGPPSPEPSLTVGLLNRFEAQVSRALPQRNGLQDFDGSLLPNPSFDCKMIAHAKMDESDSLRFPSALRNLPPSRSYYSRCE